jgi:hypothetical protein
MFYILLLILLDLLATTLTLTKRSYITKKATNNT